MKPYTKYLQKAHILIVLPLVVVSVTSKVRLFSVLCGWCDDVPDSSIGPPPYFPSSEVSARTRTSSSPVLSRELGWNVTRGRVWTTSNGKECFAVGMLVMVRGAAVG